MADSMTISCTADDIDMSIERWEAIMNRPDLCQQFGCSAEADRYCDHCRTLFCPGGAAVSS